MEKAGQAGLARPVESEKVSPTERLAGELAEEGLISLDLMIQALKDRHIHLFVSLLAKRTGLRRTLITRFLLEESGEGLAITCKAVDATSEQFMEIYRLTGKARSVRGNVPQVPHGPVLTLYEKMKRETAGEVVRHWLRNAEYLSAIRMVEQSRNDAA